MSVDGHDPTAVLVAPGPVSPVGPATRARQRRAAAVYAVAAVAGTALLLAAPRPAWQAVGVGLWFPGAGFLAAGGWWSLVSLAVAAATVAAQVARHGASASPVLPLVWAASAALAGPAARGGVSVVGVVLAGAVLAATLVALTGRELRQRRRMRARAARRRAYLDPAVEAVRERAPRLAPLGDAHELSAAGVREMRRLCAEVPALRAAEEEAGAVTLAGPARRQRIVTTALALALRQAHYTQQLAGSGTRLQRELIEAHLDHRAWRGNGVAGLWAAIRRDGDPVGAHNLAVTGSMALQVALYTAMSGDARYLRPGGLVLRGRDGQRYEHGLHDFVAPLLHDLRRSPFALQPARETSAAAASGLRALMALGVLDRVTGTRVAERAVEEFRYRLEAEFLRPDLTLVPVRSTVTGLALPPPLPDSITAVQLNPLFPDLAQRAWALARAEQFTRTDDGRLTATPGTPAPVGLRPEEALCVAALEHGDDEAARACLAGPAEEPAPVASLMPAVHLTFPDAWRRAVTSPGSSTTRSGPVLDTDDPAVLVAKAHSTGHDLALVLYPDGPARQHRIDLARLQPNRAYDVSSRDAVSTLVADPDGRLAFPAVLDGRSPLHVQPTARERPDRRRWERGPAVRAPLGMPTSWT